MYLIIDHHIIRYVPHQLYALTIYSSPILQHR